MSWLTRSDRILHFRYGLVLGFFSILLAVLAAFAKELKDEYDYQGFDWFDLLATILGGLLGQSLSLLLFYVIFLIVS